MTAERPAIDPELLDVLACPVTRVPLRQASVQELARINDAIARKELRRVDGRVVPGCAGAALVRQDGARAYLMLDGIWELCPEDGVELAP